ncbi:MAG: hypothetical protein ACKV2T_40665 [Kofleriaceae bacterium]
MGVSLVGTAFAGEKPAAAKKAAAKKAPKKAKPAPPKKKAPPPSAANQKKLEEKMGGFKFGMSKDEILGGLEKQIAERYDEKLKATTDVAQQDRIRKERKTELARVKATFVSFEEKKESPWGVSIVEGEFAHGTEESMMERWENDGGKNNRRFFFFYQGKLWKMFISLDVSILPEDKKNFDTLQQVMTAQFGAGDVEPGVITWTMPKLEVRALDKLRTYDAIGLVLEDPTVKKDLLALREAKAPPKRETSATIKAVIDPENKDKPDVKGNSGAVDAVIKAQGGK